jgi:N-acetylmuramoyl-L-alanine amidase
MKKRKILGLMLVGTLLFSACGKNAGGPPVSTTKVESTSLTEKNEFLDETTAETTTETTAETTAETTTEILSEASVENTSEITVETTEESTAEPTVEPTADSAIASPAETTKETTEAAKDDKEEATEKTTEGEAGDNYSSKYTIKWNADWKYASFSKINSDSVTLYKTASSSAKNKTIAINAGHGTKGGTSVKTQCHPDGSAKVSGGSTAKGATMATAVSSGTSFLDGTSEAYANLQLAIILKDLLLKNGYDVLMIRESSDAQLDNIARTVFANNNADCHIAIHYDSTETDKGFFFIGAIDVSSYKNMEPVKSHWKEHDDLGKALVSGEKAAGVKIHGQGYMGLDLTQISYSIIPSVDIEVGDRASDYSKTTQSKIADGILLGLDEYFGK